MTIMKLRFAPSPTGALHLGNLRTAFVNHLCAQKLGGTLILRIDDTDKERNKEGAVEGIQRDLKWLGIPYSPELYFQSKRESLYQKIILALKKQQALYPCFCTPEMLEDERTALLKMGKAPKYTGRCARLSPEESQKKIESKEAFTLRLRIPSNRGKVEWLDGVRGKQSFASDHFGDFIVVREDGSATYNLASIIDDIDLGITHLIRGEDHVSNTPRQILLAEAISQIPDIDPVFKNACKEIQFIHVPLLLGPDRAKLSKRNGAKTVKEYSAMGLLPLSLQNALSLVTFAPPAGEEILSEKRTNELFEVSKIHKSPSVFTQEKLHWVNSEQLQKISDKEERKKLAEPFLKNLKLMDYPLDEVLELVWPELTLLSDLESKILPLVEKPQIKANTEEKAVVESWLTSYQEDFKSWQKEAQKNSQAKGKRLFMPLRKALTGQEHGLELKDIVRILGAEKVKERLREYQNSSL